MVLFISLLINSICAGSAFLLLHRKGSNNRKMILFTILVFILPVVLPFLFLCKKQPNAPLPRPFTMPLVYFGNIIVLVQITMLIVVLLSALPPDCDSQLANVGIKSSFMMSQMELRQDINVVNISDKIEDSYALFEIKCHATVMFNTGKSKIFYYNIYMAFNHPGWYVSVTEK